MTLNMTHKEIYTFTLSEETPASGSRPGPAPAATSLAAPRPSPCSASASSPPQCAQTGALTVLLDGSKLLMAFFTATDTSIAGFCSTVGFCSTAGFFSRPRHTFFSRPRIGLLSIDGGLADYGRGTDLFQSLAAVEDKNNQYKCVGMLTTAQRELIGVSLLMAWPLALSDTL